MDGKLNGSKGTMKSIGWARARQRSHKDEENGTFATTTTVIAAVVAASAAVAADDDADDAGATPV